MIHLIRNFLGRLIAFIDQLTSPKGLVRPSDYQAKVDRETSRLALYQFEFCPFCIKVRRSIKQMNLKIEIRDLNLNDKYREELIQGGGNLQVPCLRIQKNDNSVQWLYESSDIILYLKERYSE